MHGGSIYNGSGGVSSAGRGVLCVSRVCAFAAACRAAQTFLSFFPSYHFSYLFGAFVVGGRRRRTVLLLVYR